MISETDMKIREASEKKKALDDFMAQPTIRLLTSLIPGGEHQDTLNTLLQASFEAGWTAGAGTTALTFLKAIMDRPPRRL